MNNNNYGHNWLLSIKNIPPWVSLPPSKLKAKVQRVRRRSGEFKEKCQVIQGKGPEGQEEVRRVQGEMSSNSRPRFIGSGGGQERSRRNVR